MDDRILFLISRASNALKNHLKNEFASAGVTITPAQMGILFSLKKSGGLPMSEIGRIVSVDNAAVTRHVDSLEREGFVLRDTEPGDRRKIIIRITDQGLRQAQLSADIAHRVNGEIKEGFSMDEMEAFKRILNAFLIKFNT